MILRKSINLSRSLYLKKRDFVPLSYFFPETRCVNLVSRSLMGRVTDRISPM